MSWGFETSILPMALSWPVGSASFDYSSAYIDQVELPDWLLCRRSTQSFNTVIESWVIYAEWVESALGKKSVSYQGQGLLLFSGRAAKDDAQKLTPIPSVIYRQITNISRGKYAYPEEVLVSSVQALRDETCRLLRSVNEQETGVVRIYEWGKF